MTVACELWTDGSGTREAPGGWSYLLRAVAPDGEIVREAEGCGGDFHTTSQRMEITAVLEGMRALHPPTIVTLYTDSEYVARSVGACLEYWESIGWRAAHGGPLKNVDLWEQVLAVQRSGVKLVPVLVKGHSGLEANDHVDAVAGAQRRVFIEALDQPTAA